MSLFFLAAFHVPNQLDHSANILIQIPKKIIHKSLNLELNEYLKYRIYDFYLSDPFISNIGYIMAKNSLIQYLKNRHDLSDEVLKKYLILLQLMFEHNPNDFTIFKLLINTSTQVNSDTQDLLIQLHSYMAIMPNSIELASIDFSNRLFNSNKECLSYFEKSILDKPVPNINWRFYFSNDRSGNMDFMQIPFKSSGFKKEFLVDNEYNFYRIDLPPNDFAKKFDSLRINDKPFFENTDIVAVHQLTIKDHSFFSESFTNDPYFIFKLKNNFANVQNFKISFDIKYDKEKVCSIY